MLLLVQRLRPSNSDNHSLFDKNTKLLIGFAACVLSDFRREACKKSFGTLFLDLDNKTICLHGKQSSLKAGSSIRPVQSLQLQHDGPLKCHLLFSQAGSANKMTENAIFKGFYHYQCTQF